MQRMECAIENKCDKHIFVLKNFPIFFFCFVRPMSSMSFVSPGNAYDAQIDLIISRFLCFFFLLRNKFFWFIFPLISNGKLGAHDESILWMNWHWNDRYVTETYRECVLCLSEQFFHSIFIQIRTTFWMIHAFAICLSIRFNHIFQAMFRFVFFFFYFISSSVELAGIQRQEKQTA